MKNCEGTTPMSTSSAPLPRPKLSSADLSEKQHALIDTLYAGNCLAIAPVGFGKAVCAQTAAQELIEHGYVKRVLVLAPLKVCRLTWATEYTHWSHLWQPACALGDPTERAAAINSDAQIVVMNIENLPWLIKEKLHGSFDGLVVDEISKFKSAGSRSVSVLRRLKNFTWRVGLSATPVAECGADIYAQALVLDGGAALGTRQDTFLTKYMTPTDYTARSWAWLPGGAENCALALRTLVYVADGAEYTDTLPPLVDNIDYITLPDDVRQHYTDMLREGVIDGLDIEAPNAAVIAGKLQQIACGAIYRDDGKTRSTHWLHTLKYEALFKLLARAGGPVLISYQYEFEQEKLTELRIPIFDGSQRLVDLWNGRALRHLAIHPKSAAHGLNLQYGGCELICLSPVWSNPCSLS